MALWTLLRHRLQAAVPDVQDGRLYQDEADQRRCLCVATEGIDCEHRGVQSSATALSAVAAHRLGPSSSSISSSSSAGTYSPALVAMTRS